LHRNRAIQKLWLFFGIPDQVLRSVVTGDA
jgi:hypothetical protein